MIRDSVAVLCVALSVSAHAATNDDQPNVVNRLRASLDAWQEAMPAE